MVTPPLIHRSAEQQATLEETLASSFASIPFHQALGFEVIKQCPEYSQVRVRMRADLIGNVTHHRLHGGVTATLLDATGGFAICVAMAEKFCNENFEQLSHRYARIGTIDLRVDYLRQAQGLSFIATGKILRLGGRIGSTQMTLENEAGELVSTGTAAYIVS